MVLDELATYQQKCSRTSVLLFPPLPSRLRYLIHRTTEDMPELTTFSVGESWCRRVVVCYSELRRDEVEEDCDLENSISCYEEPPLPRSRVEMERAAKPKSSTSVQNQAPKRPDKPLYMPRAVRLRLSLQNSPGPSKELQLPSPHSSSCSCNSTSSNSCSCSDSTENTQSSSTSNQESLSSMPHNVADSICDCGPESSPLCPEDGKQDVVLKLHEAEPLDWDQTVSYFSAVTLEEKEDLASVQHSHHTEDKGADTADLTEEIMAHLKEMETVSIEHSYNDYSGFENVWVNSDDFGHVIEIYDFPAVFTTDDLLDAFTEYSDGGMKIKWVDNTHALGVFSSESAALNALSIRHPLLKARILSEGSKKAKGKAIRRAEFIQPVKERPRTDCAVARRMVTRALGLQRGRSKRNTANTVG